MRCGIRTQNLSFRAIPSLCCVIDLLATLATSGEGRPGGYNAGAMADAGLIDIEDHAVLAAYLRQSGRVAQNEPLQLRTLAGGVSNKTVWVGQTATGEAWVLKQALPKLRTKADWYSDPARIGREALALRWLPQLAPPGTITPLVFEDEAQFLLAMQAVPEPHENWKAMLLDGRMKLSHLADFAILLATIHRAAFERRDELAPLFDDRSFFESLRLEPYYAYSASQVPAAADFLSDLIGQTRARRLTLVHGDYSPKNVLVRDDRLILLDHEVIHFGDPAFDLGFALTHLLSKAHYRRRRDPRTGGGAAWYVWDCYADNLGPVPWRADLERWAVRHTLGCLLARVAGRSPLEYLNDDERGRQREAVVALMREPPATVKDLSVQFMERL